MPDLQDYRPGDVENGHDTSADDPRPLTDGRGGKKRRRPLLWAFLAVQVPFIVLFVWVVWFYRIDCGATTSAYECQQYRSTVVGMGLLWIMVYWAFTNVAVGLTYAIYRKFGDRLLP